MFSNRGGWLVSWREGLGTTATMAGCGIAGLALVATGCAATTNSTERGGCRGPRLRSQVSRLAMTGSPLVR